MLIMQKESVHQLVLIIHYIDNLQIHPHIWSLLTLLIPLILLIQWIILTKTKYYNETMNVTVMLYSDISTLRCVEMYPDVP